MDFKEENRRKLQFGSYTAISSLFTQKLENTVKFTHSENKIRCSGTECGNGDVDFVQRSSMSFWRHEVTYHLTQGCTEFKGIQGLKWGKYYIFSFTNFKLKLSNSFN